MKIHKTIYVGIVLVITASIGLYVRNTNNKPYSFLKDAVHAALPNELGDPQKGYRDCYPMNSNKTSCPSLTYVVNEGQCLLMRGKLRPDIDHNQHCSNTYGKFIYQDKTIYAFIGEGQNDQFWVQVWLEEDM